MEVGGLLEYSFRKSLIIDKLRYNFLSRIILDF
jgi:hypothetical protein